MVDPPVISRLRQVVAYVSNMKGGDNAAMTGVGKRIADEMLSEVSDYPPAIVEFYIQQVAALIYWVGSGEFSENLPMPDDFMGRLAIEKPALHVVKDGDSE